MPKARYNPNGFQPIDAKGLKQLRRHDRLKSAPIPILITNVALWTTALCVTIANHAQAAEIPQPASSTCDIPDSSSSATEREQAARECLAERYGKVALVGFGTQSLDLMIAASESERILADGTDDLIKVDIVPIAASEEAITQLEQLNPDGCIDQNILATVPATIAKETMDLGDYSAVVGVVDMPRCDEKAVGDAHVGHQLATAYNVETVRMRGQNFLPETSDPADVIAHEIGHIYRLHHASMLEASESMDLDARLLQSGFSPEDAQETIIDLTPPSRQLSSKEYLEYGGYSNLMGRHMSGLRLSTAQKWQLQWPERVLGTQPDRQKVVNWSTVDLEPKLDEERDFAALILNDPVTFTSKDEWGETLTNTFDKLIIEPLPELTNIANVYFATSEDIHTLWLANVHLGTPDFKAQTLKVGNQIIRVENTPEEGLRVVDLTPFSR